MSRAIFRLAVTDGGSRLARGTTDAGPTDLLPADLTIEGLLRDGGSALRDALGLPVGPPIPDDARVIAPVDAQEVWAAGVTYERSREARMEEATEPSIYDRVYDAERPELFFKAAAWRVRGPGEPVAVRADSPWNAPEPELAVFATPTMAIAGFTIGNDLSSRTIEGENPLYLPQAKVYDGSCSLGPALVPASEVELPIGIRLAVVRGGDTVVDAATSSARLHRSLEDLLGWLGATLSFPSGVVLLTGTGIVAESSFSLRAGDVVRIEADGLGALENPVDEVGRA
jgi:2-dehydro-3-deoxy-D-arabinonate dehydratase